MQNDLKKGQESTNMTIVVRSVTPIMYLEARKWANKKGVSIQDLQRKAMEFYLNHLNHDAIVFAENGQPITRATIKNDVKRANSYQR